MKPDNFVAPVDVLYVINYINSGLGQMGGEGEGGSASAVAAATDDALWSLLESGTFGADLLASPRRRT